MGLINGKNDVTPSDHERGKLAFGMMKSPVEQTEEIVSTTSLVKNCRGLPLKKNFSFIEHLEKLKTNHNVTLSSTMIKVSYKKVVKDQYKSSTSQNTLDISEESKLIKNNMNSTTSKSEYSNKNKSINSSFNNSEVINSNYVLVPSKLRMQNKGGNNGPVFHSTPKPNIEVVDKRKREYVNGLNLIVKHNAFITESLTNNENHKVQNPPASSVIIHKKTGLKLDLNSKNLEKIKAGKKVQSILPSLNNIHKKATFEMQLNTKVIDKAKTGKKINSENFSVNGVKLLKNDGVVKLSDTINSKNHTVRKKPEPKKLSDLKKKINKNGIVIKNDKKTQQGIKRKLEEPTGPNKKIKKLEGNLLNVKKLAPVKVNKSNSKEQCKKSTPMKGEGNDLKEQPKKPAPTKNTKAQEPKVLSFGTKIKEDKIEEKIAENSRSWIHRRELLHEDPELPPGWKRIIHTRYQGTPEEKHVVYVFSPQGKKFQFKWKLRRYLEKIGSPLNADQFHFGLYKRTKPYEPVEEVKMEIKTEDAISPVNTTSEISSKTKIPNSKFLIPFVDSAKQDLDESDDKDENYDEATSSLSPSKTVDAEGRQLLLHDPDLPFGWKRIINTKNSTGKLQVHIISPEGRIFRRRYRLNEYLVKHQYTHNLDRFYFGLYPRKEPLSSTSDNGTENSKSLDDNIYDEETNSETMEMDDSVGEVENISHLASAELDKIDQTHSPMYDDPNLPQGWRRFIKIRSCGESAGRMEVVIVSPDGRRHRSKGHLENYLLQNKLNYKIEDFDFTVFGRNKKRSLPMINPKEESLKKKPKSVVAGDRPVTDFDYTTLKDVIYSREGEMINTVNGLMVTSGLSSARSERRLRLPRSELEKIIKSHLESEDVSNSECDIPTHWIQRLVKCRSDFGLLEEDAAVAIAEKTKDFVQELAARALQTSECPEAGLAYEDVAEVVDQSEGLAPLRVLIPKKITYKEYLRLNRPKQFTSFT